MNQAPPAARRLSGWKLLGLLLGGLLLISVAVLVPWYLSDADLRAAIARAHAAGVPTTWAEIGLTQSPTARLSTWERIVALSKTINSYEKVHGGDTKAPRLKPYEPIPHEVRDHYAALDQSKLDELLAVIDQLGEEPLVLRSEASFSTLMPEISVYRETVRLLYERVLLADTDHLSSDCKRLLKFVNAHDCHQLISVLVQLSNYEIALRGVAARLRELKERDPQLADLIERTSERLPLELRQGLSGEFVCLLDLLLGHTHYSYYSAFGADLPPWPRWCTPLVVRAGRTNLLRLELDELDLLLSERNVRSLMDRIDQLEKTTAAFSKWNPTHTLTHLVTSMYSTVVDMTYRSALHGRLIAAELRGQPWPVDDFDPAGKPLRRIERGGQLMGAYTLDKSGVDAGGKKPDNFYFPLYGPLEAPKPPTVAK